MQAGAASFSTGILASPVLAADGVSAIDRERMRSVAAFTAETLSTDHPMPFGAESQPQDAPNRNLLPFMAEILRTSDVVRLGAAYAVF